jgi:glycine C-acetyltransferase
MDGTIANLPKICELADRYNAMVMIDDSHATGFLGANGRGSHEQTGTMGRIDIITGTLGKALGGASGGFTSGRREVIDLLRQRSRPYLFSNTLAPAVAGASIEAIKLAGESSELRERLWANTAFFRAELTKRKFDIVPGEHPIVPIMFYDAAKASRVAERMLELGVYVIAFSYPVVPMGRARIRTQVSAAHSREDLQMAVEAFERARSEIES